MPTDDTVAIALLALDARVTAIEESTDETVAALLRHGLLDLETAARATSAPRPLPGQAPLPGL